MNRPLRKALYDRIRALGNLAGRTALARCSRGRGAVVLYITLRPGSSWGPCGCCLVGVGNSHSAANFLAAPAPGRRVGTTGVDRAHRPSSPSLISPRSCCLFISMLHRKHVFSGEELLLAALRFG